MEDRLLPINILLGLLMPHDIGTPLLHVAGFQLAGLEIPAGGPHGSVVIDAVIFHPNSNHLVQIEAKSGNNVEGEQAVRYGKIRAEDVVQSAYVTLPARTRPTLETVYLCLAEKLDRVRLGLETLNLSYPIIGVSTRSVELHRSQMASRTLAQAFAEGPVELPAPPPRIIPFDEESDIQVVKRFVLPVLVEAMSTRVTQLTCTSLAERATPHFGLYGRRAQGRLKRKIAEAARQIAAAEPNYFQWIPPAGQREGLMRILRTPEDNDARGRTQAYRAVGRQSVARRRFSKPPWHPDQLDLLAELETRDNEGDQESDEQEAER